METKDGIKISSKGLFLPTKYFRHMAKRLEVLVSGGEIVIHSSAKHAAPDKFQRKRQKNRRTKTPTGL
jgi:23S rRNA G2069 N7-methylase RlmK/C1962 C5-methylase RlmI